MASSPPAPRLLGQILSTWTRRDWIGAAALLGVIVVMHIVAFTVMFGMIAPHEYRIGKQVFGVGLGITAYTFGLRHAFDADLGERHFNLFEFERLDDSDDAFHAGNASG